MLKYHSLEIPKNELQYFFTNDKHTNYSLDLVSWELFENIWKFYVEYSSRPRVCIPIVDRDHVRFVLRYCAGARLVDVAAHRPSACCLLHQGGYAISPLAAPSQRKHASIPNLSQRSLSHVVNVERAGLVWEAEKKSVIIFILSACVSQ